MNAIISSLSKTVSKAKVKCVKHGPAIAMAVGLTGMGVSIYLTYRASTKIEDAKKTRDNALAEVDACLERGFVTRADGTDEVYLTDDGDNDRRIYNTRFLVACIKYGAPAVATFALSAFLIFKGFRTEAKRLTAAGMTIAGLTTQLQQVREELENVAGQKAANDIFLGKSTHTETEMKEDGSIETREVTTTNRFVTGYTFEFSKESSPMLYSGIYERDMNFIQGTMNRANWLMNEKKGFVVFADVLQEMEIDMHDCGYALTDGSIETPGHTIIFDIDERTSADGKTYFIITVNFQGYILDKI